MYVLSVSQKHGIVNTYDKKSFAEVTCSGRKKKKLDYLTMKEVADLKSCSWQNIQRLVKDGKLDFIHEKTCKSRMKYLIPVSAIPKDLQAKYYARLKKETGLAPELIEYKTERPTKTKKISRSFEELSADEHIQLNFWCGLLKEWQGRRSQYKSKTEFDKNFVGECRLKYDDIEINEHILYRKWTAYKNDDFDEILGVRGTWSRTNICCSCFNSSVILFSF